MKAFIDTETGGLDCHTDALLSIAASCEKEEVGIFVDPHPGLQITDEAAKTNGWPDAFPVLDRQPEKDAMEFFSWWLQKNEIREIYTWNAQFDIGFLKEAARRQGVPLHLPRAICVMSMAKAAHELGRVKTPRLSLAAVAKELGVGERSSDTHSAVEDVNLLEAVYKALFSVQAPTPGQTLKFQTLRINRI